METKYAKQQPALSLAFFLFGCIGIGLIIALDSLYWGTPMFAEGWPDSSASHLIRSMVIGIAMCAVFWSVSVHQLSPSSLNENRDVSLERFSVWGMLSISIVFLFNFLFAPDVFNVLSLEDGVIETGSAVLLLGTSLAVAVSIVKSRKVLDIPKLGRLSLILLSLAFFIMAMEEISWFQRVLDIETPEAFQGNRQSEMNLHNFATDYLENIFYFGSFVFLVVLPFIRFLFPSILKHDYARVFVPRPFIAVLGASFCAYNFDMWNILFTQIAFFGSLAILTIFALRASDKSDRYTIWATVLLTFAAQSLFLAKGANFDRGWAITEYKEFLISVVFFIYALDVWHNVRVGENQALKLSEDGG